MAWAPSSSTLLAGVEGVVDEGHGVAHHGLDAGGVLAQVALADGLDLDGQAVVHLGQDGVLLLQRHLELLAEDLGVEQVLDPQPHPAGLVGVGRADAPPGRAQRVLAQIALGHPVELLVVRHDQVGVAAHHHPAHVDPLGRQRVELGQEHPGVDDHAVADDRGDVGVEDPARHQLQGEGLAVDHHRVPGVVAALVADDHLHVTGQQVGELALALVAPLGPHDHGCGHARSPPSRLRITSQCSPHQGPAPRGVPAPHGSAAPPRRGPQDEDAGRRRRGPRRR